MSKILLKDKLFGIIGEKADGVSVLPCTFIESSDSGKSANSIISKLALSLVK